MKQLKVEMTVFVKDGYNIDAIKKWEHHMDYAIDMDSYPEIDHIEQVKVTDMENIEMEELDCLFGNDKLYGNHKEEN